MINWSSIIDHIYCLYVNQHFNRKDDLIKELTRVDIISSGIFSLWEIEAYSYSKGGVLDCSYNHVQIMKDALSKEYEKILILEDDVRFLKDLNKLNEYITSIPNDADILLLDYIFGYHKKEVDRIHNVRKNNNYINFETTQRVYSCACYILSKSGMQHIVTNQEHYGFCCAPDHFTCFKQYAIDIDNDLNLKRYIPNYNVAIQKIYDNNLRNLVHGFDNSYERYKWQNVDINNYAI